jgi:hypothetical protein
MRKFLAFLVLAAILIALAPLIVAKTPLRNALLAKALPTSALRLTAHGANISWIGPSSLSGIEAKDEAGNSLLQAQSVSIDRPLGGLLLNPRDLGTIELEQPTINLTLRSNSSNLEDVLNKLVSDLSTIAHEPNASQPAEAPVEVSFKIVAGTVLITDVATRRQWCIQKVDLIYDTHGASGRLGRGSLVGEIYEAGQAAQPGRFSISLAPGAAGLEELKLQVENVALSTAEPWLSRFVRNTSISGTLSGEGVATWTGGQLSFPSDLKTSGALAIDRLDAAAPSLEGDRVRLARVEMPWRLTSQPTGLAIEELQLQSEIGRVAVRGRLDPKALAPAAAVVPAGVVPAASHDIEMRSTIDIARLAAMLPHALRIRGDTTISSGTVDCEGRYQTAEGGQLITGALKTAQLAATSAGRPFNWDQPISASFAIRRSSSSSLRVDALKCDSKFLRVDAAGSPQQFKADAFFDLNSLAEQLGQFIDLSGTQLAGTGSVTVNWQQADADRFTAKADGDLTQLRVALSDGATWAEPQLALHAQAEGSLDPISHQPTRVETAQLQIDAQGDELDARLAGPVTLSDSGPLWPIEVRSKGSIARWLTRARPWFAPGAWQVDGQSELMAKLRVSGSAFEATDATFNVNNLQATSPGWNIYESQLQFRGDGRWDGASRELAANSVQLVTSTVSLAAKDVRYANGVRGAKQMSGVAAVRADLARFAAWRAPTNQPGQYRPNGELSANVRFAEQGGRITGEVNATGQNLSLETLATASPAARGAGGAAPGYQIVWQEPKLSLRGVATYDPSGDRVAFEQLLIQSNTLQATASGQIERLSTAAECNINGALNYDLAQVTPLLWPYVGKGIQLTGREQARFAVAGRLADGDGPQAQLTSVSPTDVYQSASRNSESVTHWSRRIRAQLEFPWSGANVYGLPIGPGRLAAALGDGGIRVQPINLAVGEGQLTAAPSVRFDPAPAELIMPAGPVVTNVRISPEVSEAMLKYVAPVLAGATQSEGQFSLQLQGARVPLGDAKKADSAGQLTVHSVRVVPGAMAREIVGIAQQIEAIARRRDPTAVSARPQTTLLAISDQQVNFRVVDGRVHHQNLEFVVGDVVCRSQGSVGLDETVAITLQVPIQDRWIEKEPLLAGLKGQSLAVPVSGTLTRPQLDRRAVGSLSTQLLQSAAGEAVGGELNKALDKLFKSR